MKKLFYVTLFLLWGSSMMIYGQKKEDDSPEAQQARDAWKTFTGICDKNQDGKIDRSELPKIKEDKVAGEAKFKKMDKNGDGFITEDEYIVYYKEWIIERR